MKKQIILYIIQTIIPIETIFMLMVAFICQSAKDFSKYWLILLSFQIPIVCMVVFSTIAYYESYLNETEKWREQLKKMEQEWKSNPEFIGCLIEVEKRNGTNMKLRELANLKCGVLCNLYLTSSRLCTDMKMVSEEIGLFEVAKTEYADYEVLGFDVKPVKPGILIIVICKEELELI